MPAVYEFTGELAYPVGEGSALGFFIGFCSITAFIFGLIFSAIVKGEDKEQTVIGIGILEGCYIITFITIILLKENLNRIRAE